MPDEAVRKRTWVLLLLGLFLLVFAFLLIPTYVCYPGIAPQGGSCGSVPVQLYLLRFVPGGVFVSASIYDLRIRRIKEAVENDK